MSTADMLSGSLELDYSAFDSTSTDMNGNVIKTRMHDLNQQYNLYLNSNPFPFIHFTGGFIFQKDVTDTRVSNSGDQTFSTDTVTPTIDIMWQDPYNIFSAGGGYRLQKTSTESTGTPKSTLVNEDYHTYLGWRPVDLPQLSIQTINQDRYDESRLLLDVTTKSVLASALYTPVRGLDLNYSINSIDINDKLTSLMVQSLLQNGRVNYSDTFWGGRLTLAAGCNISLAQTDTSQGGNGAVSFQVFPLTGLSNVTDFPSPTDTLLTNQLLIDGNTTFSAGVNIGSSLSLANDTKFRELGHDYGVITEVNTILVWTSLQLTADIANSFTWDIYTSADNVTWTPYLTNIQTNVNSSCTALAGPCATFGPFVNAFSIFFPNVSSRYIKVVTKPLSPAVPGAASPIYQNIFVTEMQAFLNKSASSIRGTTSTLNQQYNTNISILIVPGVQFISSYNLNESVIKTNGMSATTQQYTLTNGLNLTRIFKITPWLTAGALFTRNDLYNSSGQRVGTWNYGGNLTAVPLRTLRATLVYSGLTADNGARSDVLTLTTTAELYPGINVNANAGAASAQTGQLTGQIGRTTGVNFLVGMGIVPNPKVSLNANYQTIKTESSISGAYDQRRSEVDITYRPFEALFLTAAIAQFYQTSRTPSTIQNYGINWSPVPGGTLQLSFLYSETYASDTSTLTKYVGPTVTWLVTTRSTLILTYFELTTNSPQQTQDARNILAQFKLSVF